MTQYVIGLWHYIRCCYIRQLLCSSYGLGFHMYEYGYGLVNIEYTVFL